MNKCNWETEVQRWFDGEANDAGAVAQHLAACDACRAFADDLTGLREATRASVEGVPGIPDMQMSAFLAGIRQKIEEESVASPAWRFHWGRLWTFASLAAAALIVAVSALIMFNPKPERASATVVESVKTEVDGANVKPYKSKDGSATVWVNLPQDDVW